MGFIHPQKKVWENYLIALSDFFAVLIVIIWTRYADELNDMLNTLSMRIASINKPFIFSVFS